MLSEKCYACVHVIDAVRPVLYACREDGDLMFSCGGFDHEQSTQDWKVVHSAHVIDADTTTARAVALVDGEQAERESIDQAWKVGPLSDS